ncbi:GtrA family protein [Streptomyces sp. NPDC088725]|uniref:GtrA family protein n=1 Tax=Streptomyces sp. NPDC088725 TaxID=3365873 RepID=UPI003816B361
MNERHARSSRLGKLYGEIAKFGMVGLSGIVVNILVFNLVRSSTGLQTVRASVLATAAAVLGNYIGFRYFTYRDRPRSSRRRELSLFLGFSAVGLLIENAVLFTATYELGLDSPLLNNFFKFVGIGVATLFRFWSYRTWVFKAQGARQAAESMDLTLPQVRLAGGQGAQ